MENIYFKQYRQDVIKLARSMVIKFNDIALQINKELLVEGHYVDQNDPRSWKYYLNMNGQYHASDKPMLVKSSDTLEIIEFNRANLSLHLATLREFYPGSYQYNNLVNRFPDQEQLIRGILYPVDLDTAINAEDGDILFYDSELIEENEDDLLHRIQDWIRVFKFRWYNESYKHVDEFNLHAFLGNFYKALPLKIMNLRLSNCNSNKAHSYYIKEYLASNNNLDDFFDYLDLRQKLWLYRNIRFLSRNSGKTEIFQRIVDNILTPKSIPLMNYNLVQDSDKLLEDLNNSVKLRKVAVNLDPIDPDDQYEDLNLVIHRENYLARDNAKVIEDAKVEVFNQMSSGYYASLPTKVLDSEMFDRSSSSVRRLSNVLLTQWVHLITDNRYRAYTTITHPRSGEFLLLSVRDAFILMLYCYSKYYDRPVEYVPTFYIYEALRDPLPNFFELRQLVPKSHVSDELITAFQDMFKPMSQYISIEQFHKDCVTMHENYIKQWEGYSYNEHHRTRSYLEQITKAHYVSRKIQLFDEPTKYDDLFRNLGVDTDGLLSHELAQLAVDCFSYATGNNLFQKITISEIQGALLELTARLSSYPLQFLRNTTLSDFHVTGVPTTRLGDIETEAGGHTMANVSNVTVKHLDGKGFTNIDLGNVNAPDLEYDFDMTGEYKIDPTVNIRDVSYRDAGYYVPIKPIGLRSINITVHQRDGDGNLDIYED